MNDERIIAYLLEELTEDELERFEDECFALESWPAQIDMVEGDLVEDYLRGDLPPERRRRFEQTYLTTAARRQRVRLAAALLRQVDECAGAGDVVDERASDETAGDAAPGGVQTPPGWFQSFWTSQTWALRATLALLLTASLVGVWWLSRSRQQQNIAMLSLSVSYGERAKGDPAAPVKLSPDISALRISLTLPERPLPASRYRVELENVSGDKKTLEALGLDARSVSVEISASQLESGQYALKLFAVQADGTEQRIPGSYFFIVE